MNDNENNNEEETNVVNISDYQDVNKVNVFDKMKEMDFHTFMIIGITKGGEFFMSDNEGSPQSMSMLTDMAKYTLMSNMNRKET